MNGCVGAQSRGWGRGRGDVMPGHRMPQPPGEAPAGPQEKEGWQEGWGDGEGREQCSYRMGPSDKGERGALAGASSRRFTTYLFSRTAATGDQAWDTF